MVQDDIPGCAGDRKVGATPPRTGRISRRREFRSAGPRGRAVLVGLVCMILGIAVGPALRTAWRVAILRLSPQGTARTRAATELAGCDRGRRILRRIGMAGTLSGRREALFELLQAEKPWELHTMLQVCREQGRMEEYLDVLAALDYSDGHRKVLSSLAYEARHQPDAGARERAIEILDKLVSCLANGNN